MWTSTVPQAAQAPCAQDFPDTKFQDLHDGDVKTVSLSGSTLTMGQEGIWSLTTTVDPKTCQAIVDFSTTTKPDQPPVPLVATVAVAVGAAGDEAVQIIYTDETGELNDDPVYPLNIWQAV